VSNIGKKELQNPIKTKINKSNSMLFLPDKEKLALVFCVHFDMKTDLNLAKLFYRELEDAKANLGGTIDVKYYNSSGTIPDDIMKFDPDYNKYNTGFLVFSNFFILI